MDETLSELLENSKGRSLLGFDSPDVEIQLSDVTPGLVSFGDGDKRQEYMLKPLKELYGIGNGTEAVDPESDTFMPLFLAIEETIAGFDADTRRLTDAEVALALGTLSLSPEAASADPLIQEIQLSLRLTVSLNNYSRQEVRQAIRRIARSVQRHTESGRGRAYLDFIEQFLSPDRG